MIITKATTNKYKRIKGINKTVPLFCKSKSIDNENIIKISYDELVKLRDDNQLIPGTFYRIIDYEFTFSTPNVKSAEHQFDIILVALNENELAEEGWAIEHKFDMTEYHFTDNNNVTGNVYAIIDTVSCYIITTDRIKIAMFNKEDAVIDEVNKTIVMLEGMGITFDNMNAIEDLPDVAKLFPNLYFRNSNLSAWKVWYCLDNDNNRFAWAKQKRSDIPSYMDNAYVVTGTIQDSEITAMFVRNKDKDNDDNNIGVKLYAYDMIYDETTFEVSATLYATEESISIGTFTIYMFDGDNFQNIGNMDIVDIRKYKNVNGKGVIYRLIDEFNNDCCCDFKNYMFKDIDHMDGYKYILNGDEVHDNKIYRKNNGSIKHLPYISLIGTKISYNNIVNSDGIYIGDTDGFIVHNSIINCDNIDIYGTCTTNILNACIHLLFRTGIGFSTLINTKYTESYASIDNVYIINCEDIKLRRCEHITMFNCNHVTFKKDFIYNLFAKDIEYVEITSNDTTSLTNKIQYIEILPGIKGTLNSRIIITIPVWTSGCTIVKPDTVNEIIVS